MLLTLYLLLKSMEPLSFDSPEEIYVVRRYPTPIKVCAYIYCIHIYLFSYFIYLFILFISFFYLLFYFIFIFVFLLFYFYIYLLDTYHIPLPRGQRATMPRKETRRKERRKKRIEAEGEIIHPNAGK